MGCPGIEAHTARPFSILHAKKKLFDQARYRDIKERERLQLTKGTEAFDASQLCFFYSFFFFFQFSESNQIYSTTCQKNISSNIKKIKTFPSSVLKTSNIKPKMYHNSYTDFNDSQPFFTLRAVRMSHLSLKLNSSLMLFENIIQNASR